MREGKEELTIFYYSKSKYRNTKTVIDGITFDSKKEARRWKELRLLEDAGEIKDLKRQVRYELIPTQKEPDTIGSRGGTIKGKVIERKVEYIADFVYVDTKTGETVVEDTKGIRTPDYKIKRKLMLWVHGIRIQEI